jgi:sugar phosphate permease
VSVKSEGLTRSPKIFSTSTKVLILICLMYGLTYIDRNNVSTAAVAFEQDLHLTNTQIGLVFSAFAYPYLVFQIFGGWVSDRFGARVALTVSAIVWASATLFTGLVNTLTAMLALRVVLGFGEGAAFPTATRAMSDWTARGKRAFAQGVTHSSARLGNAITPPVMAWLMGVLTWRGSFVVLGIISLAWAAVWGMYFRDDPREHRGITAQELAWLPSAELRRQKAQEPVPWSALAKRMFPVTAVYFCYGWTLWLYLAWIPSYFLHRHHLDLTHSALYSAGVFFAGVVGNILGGICSDRILNNTSDHNKARRNLVVIGLLGSLFSMAPTLFSQHLTHVAICLSLAFFFAEFTIGPMWAIPMDIAPRFSGSASGLMNTGSALAAIISPLVSGFVIDRTGNWELPFLGSMGLLLLGAILAFWMKPGEGLTSGALVGGAAAAKEAAI